jgi:hypothetical protein
MKEIPHKMSDRQLQVIRALEITSNTKEIQAMLNWQGRELSNMIGYLYQRRFIRRIKKHHYIINENYLYYKKEDESFQLIEGDSFKIDLNQIPKELQDFIWENREMKCTELKRLTGIPRFYIRQLIYEKKLKYFPRNSKSL